MVNHDYYRVCSLYQEPPACGADGRTPTFALCDCCGVEWGYEASHLDGVRRYRAQWLASGGAWRWPRTRPADWDRVAHLAQIPLEYR